MDALPNLKVVSNFGVGVDHINLDDAKSRGIPVGNTPDCLNETVADMAFALLLSSARNVVEGDRIARDPQTKEFAMNWFGSEVNGATLGIVGLGRIGEKIAKRALGFDMKVVYYSRHRNENAEKQFGAVYADLEGLLRQSDFVVLVVPLTSHTKHMISTAQFECMKPTATLINMARGGVVDHDALLKALDSGKLLKAALDVTEPEPLPRGHPLLSNKKVTFTPHLGSATLECRRRMTGMSVTNLSAGLKGEELRWKPY